MSEINANYDEPWKEAIGEYFDSFLNFFFPKVYELIDWSKKPIALDKELQKITADSQDSKRFVDKLFKVWLKDNQEVWILIHIEVQSQQDGEFSQRMFIYHYRAFDLYRKPVLSLAILGDEVKSWRPTNYGYNIGGCKINLEFPTIKLLDYQNKWEALESDLNPFALMVRAHLKTKETSSNLTERERVKWLLIRSLYEKGYQKKEIVKLFKFIDLMMTLPSYLQESLNQKIDQYEEERKMPIVSPYEQMAMEKGMLTNLRANIISILEKRFGELSPDLASAVNAIEDTAILQNLLLETVTVNSVRDFQNILEK